MPQSAPVIGSWAGECGPAAILSRHARGSQAGGPTHKPGKRGLHAEPPARQGRARAARRSPPCHGSGLRALQIENHPDPIDALANLLCKIGITLELQLEHSAIGRE